MSLFRKDSAVSHAKVSDKWMTGERPTILYTGSVQPCAVVHREEEGGTSASGAGVKGLEGPVSCINAFYTSIYSLKV